ncbi:MAG: hypothetical protein J1F63_04310 [Oscillospiraceae bacterium]|nr:hypothetical protein [Oscillospiraceae bacterium]
MNYCEMTALVTAIANSLARSLSQNEINLLGALFSQLGDTLETIAAAQSMCSPQGGGSGSIK